MVKGLELNIRNVSQTFFAEMAGSEYSYPSPQALLPPGISWSPSVDCLSLPLLTPLPSLPNYSPIDIRLMLMLMLTLIVYPSHANFSSLPIIPSASGNSYSISIMKQLQPHQLLWCNFVVDYPYMYIFHSARVLPPPLRLNQQFDNQEVFVEVPRFD